MSPPVADAAGECEITKQTADLVAEHEAVILVRCTGRTPTHDASGGRHGTPPRAHAHRAPVQGQGDRRRVRVPRARRLAPQVRLAAERRVLAERVCMAYQDCKDVHDRIGRRGTCAACERLTPRHDHHR